MGKGPVGRWGVIFKNITVGGSKPFLLGGVKNFFDHFFPFYEIFTNFQFEIFMGVPLTINHLKIL